VVQIIWAGLAAEFRKVNAAGVALYMGFIGLFGYLYGKNRQNSTFWTYMGYQIALLI
jgi:sugar phosphate permease